MIILFGSEHHCEQSINFGKQLIDTFKPKSILIEERPLEISKQDAFEDDNGLIYPQINEQIYKLKNVELKNFIEQSILKDEESYEVNLKENMVYKKDFNGLPTKVATDFPTYAMYHLQK